MNTRVRKVADYQANLREAVERLHGCHANYRESSEVQERYKGESVWHGIVQIFDLEGHPEATVCYAWSSPVEGSDRRKFYAVLHIPPVDSPEAAVRAAIVSDSRK